MKKNYKIISIFFIFVIFFTSTFAFAQEIQDINAENLLPKVEIFVTPKNSTFLVGSTFEAPIYINTKGNDINAINLGINFDPNKLAVINPSGGKSIFGIWVEPPQYDNKKGFASMAGIVPGGIVTSSGLIVTMTFKVLSAGNTQLTISDLSSANLNDGLGSEVLVTKSNGFYVLNNKSPDGVLIFSESHPSQDTWYNNNNIIFGWETSPNITGFNVDFNNAPQAVLKNEVAQIEASKYYENVKDGIWYMHVKAIAKGLWGNTTHFQVRIDTGAPAEFKIVANKIKEESGDSKYLISFFTTDTLSGVVRYEVGVINKSLVGSASPVFIETQSPYLVPVNTKESAQVIVRAFDAAGNMQESYLDLYPMYSFTQIIKKFGMYFLIFIVLLLLLELILHYLFGHHILDHVKRAYKVFKNMPADDNIPINKSISNESIPVELPVPTPTISIVTPESIPPTQNIAVDPHIPNSNPTVETIINPYENIEKQQDL